MEINALVLQLAALAGFGGLVAALVNIGKQIGLVQDGQAQIYSTGLNLAGLVALFALKVFAPAVSVEGLDSIAAQVAQFLTVAFGLFVQLGGARFAHDVLRGVPVIGKSYTK